MDKMNKSYLFCLLTVLMLILSGLVPIINVNADVDNNGTFITEHQIISNGHMKTLGNHGAGARPPLTEPCKSWVEVIDGVPRLMVNGKPMPLTGYYGCW